MTIKAQDESSRDRRDADYWEGVAARLSDRLLDQGLRADSYLMAVRALLFWALIATAVAILEAVT